MFSRITQRFLGIFGCLATIIQVFLGVQCGVTLQAFAKNWDRLIRWIIWGVVLGLITCALTFFTIEDGVIPMNKQMW